MVHASAPKLRRAQIDGQLVTAALIGGALYLTALLRAQGGEAAPARTAPSAARPRRWKDILVRTWREFNEDRIALVAAGVSFYVLLALFPALLGFVTLYGLIAEPSDAFAHASVLRAFLPGPVLNFIGRQMMRLAEERARGLSLAMIGALAVVLWSANGAAKAMFMGLNVAYDVREKRGFVLLNLGAFAFTIGMLAFAIVLALLLVAPPLVGVLKPDARLLAWAAWPAQFILILLALETLYRFGPSRTHARWRWISWGGASAALLWLAGSSLFSIYVGRIARFEVVYGPLAAVMTFVIWLYWSVLIVLVGAELNAEIERQGGTESASGAQTR